MRLASDAMPLLREDSDFAVAIGRAARALGDLDPGFVEKDYWVTQVLRALHAEYAGGFMFKGGTSLSKGYGIIERFSEDVDILVTPPAGASVRALEDHLRAITGAVAGRLGLTWEEARPPGRGRDGSRGDYIRYAAHVEEGLRLGIHVGAVLLETGYAGGREPAEMVTITPLLCSPLEIDPEAFEDTMAFQLPALEPRRTLIEKLFSLHHLATLHTQGDVRDAERFGRHYYDVFKLLEHRTTVQRLTQDRQGFNQLVAEVERLSRLHFGGTSPRPEGGFASSPAFTHERDSELRNWLERKYTEAIVLLPRQARPPSFGQVLQRVHQFAEVL
jgi:hypothetical protein